MRSLIVVVLVLISSSAFARQYIQCSITDVNSTDVMVVNLQTPEGGTLFLSSGMQNPENERVLVKITFDKKENGRHIYKVVEQLGTGSVEIPSDIIGRSSNAFIVTLSFSDYSFEYSCFARIYND